MAWIPNAVIAAVFLLLGILFSLGESIGKVV